MYLCVRIESWDILAKKTKTAPLAGRRRERPRRADARLGSAYAHNYRGCRQIEAVNATQSAVLPRGTITNKPRLNEEKNTEIRFNEPATTLTIRHMVTNSGRKQQEAPALLLQQQQQYSDTRAAAEAAAALQYACI